MEKNQQKQDAQNMPGRVQEKGVEQRPGQQLPPETKTTYTQPDPFGENSERHSESSFPQADNETLGTP